MVNLFKPVIPDRTTGVVGEVNDGCLWDWFSMTGPSGNSYVCGINCEARKRMKLHCPSACPRNTSAGA